MRANRLCIWRRAAESTFQTEDHCICVRGFVIRLQRTQRETLKAAAGSLFGPNHDGQTGHADLFFFSSPYSFTHCPTQTCHTEHFKSAGNLQKEALLHFSTKPIHWPKKSTRVTSRSSLVVHGRPSAPFPLTSLFMTFWYFFLGLLHFSSLRSSKLLT